MTTSSKLPGIRVMQMPVISTAHLDQATAERLTAERDKNPWCTCAEWEFGFFLYLEELEMDAAEGPVPQCLQDIRDWLRLQGFTDCWVRIDRDEAARDDLPEYDW